MTAITYICTSGGSKQTAGKYKKVFENCESKLFAFVPVVSGLCFKDFQGGFIYLQKTSVSVPPYYTKEIFAVIDSTTPTWPMDDQSCFNISPPFSSLRIVHLAFQWDKSWLWGPVLCIVYGQWKYYKKRGRKMEIELWEHWGKWRRGKKKVEERKLVKTPKARCRGMIQKKMSDFPLSSHKCFVKGLGIYQKGKKKKNRSCLPKDPTPLESNDLILYEVAGEIATLVWVSWHRVLCFLNSTCHPTIRGWE